MKPPRGLTAEEAALWSRVAKTVTPLKCGPGSDSSLSTPGAPARPSSQGKGAGQTAKAVAFPASLASRHDHRPTRTDVHRRSQSLGDLGLDSSWERKLSRGAVPPDFTLDLHGASLDAAHGRLVRGLSHAKTTGARVVLVVTGKQRPADPADRTSRRGAIRAKVIDWLAASEHAPDIAAIRGAHPRHGGSGALYIILKKRRP